MPHRPTPARLLPLILSLMPLPALACPTELGAGLVYATDDGTRTTVTPAARPDAVLERIFLPEGDSYELQSLHGLFELEIVDFDATGEAMHETRQLSIYRVLPALPEPGTAAQGIMALVESASERFERRHDVVAGPLAEFELGGCTWQGYTVEVTVTEGGDAVVQSYVRVPALGLAFFVGYADAETTERYTVVSVTALAGAEPTK